MRARLLLLDSAVLLYSLSARYRLFFLGYYLRIGYSCIFGLVLVLALHRFATFFLVQRFVIASFALFRVCLVLTSCGPLGVDVDFDSFCPFLPQLSPTLSPWSCSAPRYRALLTTIDSFYSLELSQRVLPTGNSSSFRRYFGLNGDSPRYHTRLFLRKGLIPVFFSG